MSHPLVASKKRIITCGKCGETGHGAKSRVYHGQASGDQSTNEDELFVERYIYIYIMWSSTFNKVKNATQVFKM